MFARVSEVTVRPEKRQEFLNLVHKNLQKIMREQPGFVDALGLFSETDVNHGLAVVLWRTKDDAVRFYNGNSYQFWLEEVRPLLAGEPKIGLYEVDTSTFHHIAEGKAA